MTDFSKNISSFNARFSDPHMEESYRRYALSFHTDKDRIMLYAAVAVYISYSLLDLIVLTQATYNVLALRLLCAFGAILVIRFTKTKIGQKHFQLFSSGLMLIAGTSISLMILIKGELKEPPYYVGLTVVALVLTGIIRVSFRTTVIVLSTIYASFMLATLQMPKDANWIAANIFIFSCFGLAGLSNYLLEVSRRQAFVKHLERERFHQQLERMMEEAQTSLKRKNAIMNVLTHVLKTPLHQIIGYAQLLEQQPFGPQHPEYIEYSNQIHGSGKSLLELMQRLMQYSRLDAGTIRTSPQQFPARELLDCAISKMIPDIESKGIDLKFTGERVRLFCDGNLVEEAFFEILKNAVQASPESGVITIETHKDDNHMTVRIIDEGPGISDDQLSQIRDSMELTEEFLSVGDKMSLGVTLTDKIVALHGGTLKIHRRDPCGTVVEFLLPAPTTKESNNQACNPTEQAAPRNRASSLPKQEHLHKSA